MRDVMEGNWRDIPAGSVALVSLYSVVEDAERAHRRKVLLCRESSMGKTAEVPGIARKTLVEKMERLEINA